MKTNKLIRASFLILALGAYPLFAQQAESLNLGLKPESRLWLAGDSTLHAFTSTATVMNLTDEFTAPKGEIAEVLKKAELKQFELHIPVQDLKSGKKGLDKNLYQALNAKAFPEIVFSMQSYEMVVSSGVPMIKAQGKLSISGKENPIELEMKTAPAAQGLRVSGEKNLLMTDYGVKPPSLMLGTIKVANKITVYYDLILESDGGSKANDEKTQESK